MSAKLSSLWTMKRRRVQRDVLYLTPSESQHLSHAYWRAILGRSVLHPTAGRLPKLTAKRKIELAELDTLRGRSLAATLA